MSNISSWWKLIALLSILEICSIEYPEEVKKGIRPDRSGGKSGEWCNDAAPSGWNNNDGRQWGGGRRSNLSGNLRLVAGSEGSTYKHKVFRYECGAPD